MAIAIHSTSISRRTMLAGSVVAPTIALIALPKLATLSGSAVSSTSTDINPDIRLFRRIAVAERLRNRHARARRLRDRLRKVPHGHRQYSALPKRGLLPYCATAQNCAHLFWRYVAAVRGAVAVPAYTMAGIHAKLALAVIAAQRCDARIYMYEDREWLEAALIDLKHLADQEAKTRR